MRDGTKLKLARNLRKAMTDAEQKLWGHLRRCQVRGFRFRRQHPVGPYVADFACLEAKLIIEVDGGQHCDSSTDRRRDAFLQSKGFRVLRFWNDDVFGNMDGVLQVILGALEETRPHPDLPPHAGEGDKQTP